MATNRYLLLRRKKCAQCATVVRRSSVERRIKSSRRPTSRELSTGQAPYCPRNYRTTRCRCLQQSRRYLHPAIKNSSKVAMSPAREGGPSLARRPQDGSTCAVLLPPDVGRPTRQVFIGRPYICDGRRVGGNSDRRGAVASSEIPSPSGPTVRLDS